MNGGLKKQILAQKLTFWTFDPKTRSKMGLLQLLLVEVLSLWAEEPDIDFLTGRLARVRYRYCYILIRKIIFSGSKHHFDPNFGPKSSKSRYLDKNLHSLALRSWNSLVISLAFIVVVWNYDGIRQVSTNWLP